METFTECCLDKCNKRVSNKYGVEHCFLTGIYFTKNVCLELYYHNNIRKKKYDKNKNTYKPARNSQRDIETALNVFTIFYFQ